MPSRDELDAARSAAQIAVLRADGLEAEARQARRLANARQKHYEDMLQIAGGQLELPWTEGNGP